MAIGSDRPYLLVKCPTCKAKVGKHCKEVPGGLHPERVQQAVELRERARRKHTEQGKSKSVYAIPTAVDSNRRRHSTVNHLQGQSNSTIGEPAAQEAGGLSAEGCHLKSNSESIVVSHGYRNRARLSDSCRGC